MAFGHQGPAGRCRFGDLQLRPLAVGADPPLPAASISSGSCCKSPLPALLQQQMQLGQVASWGGPARIRFITIAVGER